MRGRRDAVRVDLGSEPPRGFLSEALLDRLRSILESDIDADAIVLENRAGTFCMGLDPSFLIAEAGAPPGGQRVLAGLERFDRLLQAVECVARPVIALVDGPATGGGVALAAAADLVIATERATFGLPETLLGIFPPLAFPVLARRIGAPRARWMALSGVTIDASEAMRWGIADMVVDDPEATLARYLRRLTRLDGRSIAAVKRLAALHPGWNRAGQEAYKSTALETFGQLVESEETQARLRRFAQGLAPWPEDEQE